MAGYKLVESISRDYILYTTLWFWGKVPASEVTAAAAVAVGASKFH